MKPKSKWEKMGLTFIKVVELCNTYLQFGQNPQKIAKKIVEILETKALKKEREEELSKTKTRYYQIGLLQAYTEDFIIKLRTRKEYFHFIDFIAKQQIIDSFDIRNTFQTVVIELIKDTFYHPITKDVLIRKLKPIENEVLGIIEKEGEK